MSGSKELASGMREMLTWDKVGIKEGFATALSNDVNNLLCDYFSLDGDAKISVAQAENGTYKIEIEALATRIKKFETTMDMPRY